VNLRAQFLLLGPVAVMLAVHVVGLVMSERGWVAPVGTHDLWGGWNVAGAIALLIASSYAIRRVNTGEPAGRLARLTWGMSLADLAATGLIAITILRR
jgi:hypothetical protein